MATVLTRPSWRPAVACVALCILVLGTACSTKGSEEDVAQDEFPLGGGMVREYVFGSVQEMAAAADLVIVGEVVSAGEGDLEDSVVMAKAENEEDKRRIDAFTTVWPETVIRVLDVPRGSVDAEFVVLQEDGYIQGRGHTMGTFWAYAGQTVVVFGVETGSTRTVEGATTPVIQMVTTQGRFFVDEDGQLAHNYLYRPRVDSRDDNQIRRNADGSIDWSGVPEELRPEGFTPERLRNLVFEFDDVAHALHYDREGMPEPKVGIAAHMASQFSLDTMVEAIEALS
jgi:hypothetical protein